MTEESNGTVIPITDATPLTALQGGRPIKFTPERMEQIKNLVERGMSREEIAETIGVTLGSLQVTCSRMGISLRRPRLPDTSRTPLRAPSAPRQHQPVAYSIFNCRKACLANSPWKRFSPTRALTR